MLVLDRKAQQSIILNYDGIIVEIKVIEVQRDRVKIGISAPKEIVILRKELLERGDDNQRKG